MGVGDDQPAADRESASGDEPAAAGADHLDGDPGCGLHARRVDVLGNGQRTRKRGVQRVEYGRERNTGQDSLHAGQEAGRAGRHVVENVKHGRALQRIRELGARPAREAEAQEPAHDEHRHRRQHRAGDGVLAGVDALLQDLVPDRLPDRETDARSEAAADDEHQHRPKRAGERIVDSEVVEQRLRRRGADDHADEQTHVLRE